MENKLITILLAVTITSSRYSQSETKSINTIHNEIIKEFSVFDDWMNCYQKIIDLGNEQSNLEERY